MARTVDPYTWPFAVSPRHPAYIPFWIAMVINAVGVVSGLTGGDGLPNWASTVSFALMVVLVVAARSGDARARRHKQSPRRRAAVTGSLAGQRPLTILNRSRRPTPRVRRHPPVQQSRRHRAPQSCQRLRFLVTTWSKE